MNDQWKTRIFNQKNLTITDILTKTLIKHASYFVVFIVLCLFTLPPALAQNYIDPQITVSPNGIVRIAFRSGDSDASAQLAWMAASPADSPFLGAFPVYRHKLDAQFDGTAHTFTLQTESSPGQNPDGRHLPLNQIIHARISANIRQPGGWSAITTDNITFRVIKDKLGAHRLGLSFEEGPRVIAVSATEVLLQWKLNMPAASTFYYGSDPGRMAPQQGGAIGNSATVIVNKLKPGRLYHYRVHCEHPDTGDELESPLLSFRTTEKDGGDFTFAVMGGAYSDPNQLNSNHDINGINVETLSRCAASAMRNGAEFILFTGNAVTGYVDNPAAAQRQYDTWRRTLRGVNHFIPIFAAMGQREAASPWRAPGTIVNSDATPEGQFAAIMNNPVNGPAPIAGLPPYSENVFTFSHAGSHFIVLNSEYNTIRGGRPDDETATSIDRTQRIWLRGQLEQHVKAPWLFVVSHGPAWPASSAYGLALDRLPGVRDQVWEMIDNFDTDAVFSGQEPNYSHTIISKQLNPSWTSTVHQFNTGSAGAPPIGGAVNSPWKSALTAFHARPHYLLVSISGSRATIQARTPDGVIFDSVTLKKKKR